MKKMLVTLAFALAACGPAEESAPDPAGMSEAADMAEMSAGEDEAPISCIRDAECPTDQVCECDNEDCEPAGVCVPRGSEFEASE